MGLKLATSWMLQLCYHYHYVKLVKVWLVWLYDSFVCITNWTENNGCTWMQIMYTAIQHYDRTIILSSCMLKNTKCSFIFFWQEVYNKNKLSSLMVIIYNRHYFKFNEYRWTSNNEVAIRHTKKLNQSYFTSFEIFIVGRWSGDPIWNAVWRNKAWAWSFRSSSCACPDHSTLGGRQSYCAWFIWTAALFGPLTHT